ncbi:HET-s/LopB domain protein [Aspergillus terreus]|uniref:HET-s/LopB domain protein n=1 Tax=Aspergillus terreus TaxID=33178 RepID=A0A5M3YT36_ASPTE|nr:hypothetical protein ATETN484_0004000400 [Aspergillus terreus]GFF12894.1 HET-s/LopB domain protein [Aspergillus terreus]
MKLYRHPQRQGLRPEETYVMQHDIYSLEVCLLEIGFWDSFVYHKDGDTPMGPQFTSATGKTMHGKTAKSSKPGPVLETMAVELVAGKSPISIKRRLISIAHDRLPVLMGPRYADLALACLTCLDPAETNLFGQEEYMEDEDGIVVGVQYIEKVCGILFALYIAEGAQILLQIDEISI